MANTTIQAAQNWFNKTIKNGGQHDAPGNASNNTIAAAETEATQATQKAREQKKQTSTPTTTKRKDDTEGGRLTPPRTGREQPENVTPAQTSTPKESIQVTGAGNKLGNAILKEIITKPVDSVVNTAETIFVKPDGTPNLKNNIFEQIDAYNAYDNSGTQRKETAIATAVTIPTLLLGGGVAGASTRIGQAALSRAGATKFGAPIVNKLTTPVSQKVQLTPATIAANAAPAGFIAADVGYIASQPTNDAKINAAAEIASYSLVGSLGAVKGYKLAAAAGNKLKTLGKTEIPAEKVTTAGIPLGNFNEAQLTRSFEKNILSPQPYKFARANTEIGKDTASTLSAKLNKIEDATELYHATANGQYFGKRFTVQDSKSEFGGLFVAPKGISYFLGESVNDIKVTPSLFIRDFRPAESPALLNLKSAGVKPVDWQKAADSVGRSVAEVKTNKALRKEAVDNFLIAAESKSPGHAYMPMIKKEYEAVIPQGVQFKRGKTRYYTKINNTRIPIYEFEPVGFNPKKAGAPASISTRAGSSSYSSGRRTNSREYVSVASPYSGSLGTKASYSSSKVTNPREYATVPPSSYSVNPSTKTASPSAFTSAVKGTSYNKLRLYNNIAQTKATPQKITPTDTNYLSRQSNQIIKRQKKTADERKETEKLYSAVRTGRIDHLSIKDPLEFYGTGKSITDRKRPDRILRKQLLYFVDNAIQTKRPTGRRKT